MNLDELKEKVNELEGDWDSPVLMDRIAMEWLIDRAAQEARWQSRCVECGATNYTHALSLLNVTKEMLNL